MTTTTRLPRRALAWLFVFVVAGVMAPRALAHEFKLDAVINAFVDVEPTQARLLVRAPLFVFKAVKFPVRNAEIDVNAAGPALERALAALEEDVQLFENGQPLKAVAGRARLSLPSDRSFETFERAAEHVRGTLEPGVGLVVDQGYVDAEITYSLTSPSAVFAIRTKAAPELGDYLRLAVRYALPGGESGAMLLTARSGAVALNPTWWQAAAGFVGAGIAHIISGYDHLLFLLCLVIPLRLRQIVAVVTGFTLAHSFTLIGSAFGLAPTGAWFPPFVETAIALSIVYMAIEDIIGVDFRRRLLLTMLFGLVHGFGFSYGLKEELQFAGSHLVVSLFAFNLGIEIGQLAVLLVMLPALALVRRYLLPGRVGTIVLAAIVAHLAWHWMEERWTDLVNARWPTPDFADATHLLLWLAGLFFLGAAIVRVVARLKLDGDAPSGLPAPSRAD